MDPMCQAPTPDSYNDTPNSDREQFVRQLEILCETNRRLGESNDELRQALGVRKKLKTNFLFKFYYRKVFLKKLN